MVVVCRFFFLLAAVGVSSAVGGAFRHEAKAAKSVDAAEVKKVAELIEVEKDLLADKQKDVATLKNIDSEITDLVHKRDAFKHDEARKNSEIAFLQGQLGKSGTDARLASQSEVDAALQSASKIVQQAEGTLKGKATVKRSHLKMAAKVLAKAHTKVAVKAAASTGAAAAAAARAAAEKRSRAAAAAHATAELKKRAAAAAAAVARAEAAKRSRAAAAAKAAAATKAAAKAAATQKVVAKVESRAAFEARIRAEAEAKAKFKIQAEQEAEARLRAEAEAKVRAKLAAEAAAKAKVAAAAKAKADAEQAKVAAAAKQRNDLASHADDAFKEFMAEEDGEDQQNDADYEDSANALAGAIGWNRKEIETKANSAVKSLTEAIGGKKVVQSLQGMMAGVR